MRFLEIREGFSVNIDNIEAIETKDEFTSTIHTKFNTHIANFPYITLLRILEGETKEEPQKQRVMEKFEAVLDHSGHFAG